MNKTILFSYLRPFHPNCGGVERVTDILARELMRREYRVLYLYHEEKNDYPPYNYPTEIFKISDLGDSIEAYHNFLREQKVDIIIDQNGAYASSTRCGNIGNNPNVKRISVIHHNPAINHDNLAVQYFKPKHRLFFIRWIKIVARAILFPYFKLRSYNERVSEYKYLNKNSDLICLLSDKFRPVLSRFAPQIPDSKVVAIANPNTYDSQPIELLNNKRKQLLYVGRITMNQKRPDRVITIWRKLVAEFPDWELIIVGDGEDMEYLKRQAKGLSRVRFEGRQDPKSYYESASIFCLTSNNEGFPMALNEAMVHGVVPLTFDSYAAASDIINNGENGFLITPFSINEYTDRLRELMRNDQLRGQIAKQAMESAKRFSIEKVVDEWEKLF